MSWKFKASKYKNTAPIEPKKELHIRDLSIGAYNTAGNYIAASGAYMAFNWDKTGSSLALLPLNATGRQDRSMIRRVHGHSEIVTDFAFSPFDDGLLATGSADQKIKLWRLPSGGLTGDITVPELELPEQPRRVETVSWHPTADCILTTSSGDAVTLWDCMGGAGVWQGEEASDQIQSVAWQYETGKLLATNAKDKRLRVYDPRAGAGVVQDTPSHDGMKDSKVVWVGEDRILTSGFSVDRNRQLILRDTRKIGAPLQTMDLDLSAGILVPLYDPDTKMVFLTGKGDRYIQFVEIAAQAPHIVPGLRHTGEQTKGGCLVPKRVLDVMKGEVARLLQLADSSIVPITWQVPRKSYDKYHDDIYPETRGCIPSMGPQEWLAGENVPPANINLDPAKRTGESTHFQEELTGRKFRKPSIVITDNNVDQGATKPSKPIQSEMIKSNSVKGQDDVDGVVKVELRNVPKDSFQMKQIRPTIMSEKDKRGSKFGRTTKFKHLKGTTLHKSQHFENLKSLSRSTPAETDIIQANVARLAIPCAGPGGKVAIIEIAKSGRLPDGVLPSIINGSSVMDFVWDPFNNNKIYCGLDDGSLTMWIIPDGGLLDSTSEPNQKISAHGDKISIVKCNPMAEGVVATVGQDHLVKIWQVTDTEHRESIVLTGHTDHIYAMDWSLCGRFIATSCKDGKIRIYNPRKSTDPVVEGGNVVPKKGSRITWTNDNEFLLVTGFSRQSERLLTLYSSNDLKQVACETLDVSPAILIPFYDEDSSTVFLSGKGETTVHTYEIAMDPPHLFPLSPYKSSNGSQGFGFLRNKSAMNVREIEFARAYRLTQSSIEPVSFTVPRVKSTYFQDDLFPPTRVLWRPTVSSGDWLQGEDGQCSWVSLRPGDMQSLSGHSLPARGSVTDQRSLIKTDDDKEAKSLTDAVKGVIETSDELEQDKMEGVSKEEWND